MALVHQLTAALDFTGVVEAKSKMTSLEQTIANNAGEIRKSFLFMSFGMMAANQVLKKFVSRLEMAAQSMRQAFIDIEHQAVVVSTILTGTAEDVGVVTERMIQLGRETEWTAYDVGLAMEDLARAGFTTTEAIQSVGVALQFATATGMQTSQAADILTGSIRGFNMQADYMETQIGDASGELETFTMHASEAEATTTAAGHAASVFAAGAMNARLHAEDLGEGFKYAGAAAEALNWRMTEVVATMMSAADNMVRAGMAGRGFRRMATRLARAAGEASTGIEQLAGELEDLGVELVDHQGEMRGLFDILIDLEEATEDMTAQQQANLYQMIAGTRGMTMLAGVMSDGTDQLKEHAMMLEISSSRNELAAAGYADSAEIMRDLGKEYFEATEGMEHANIKLEEFTELNPASQEQIRRTMQYLDDLNLTQDEYAAALENSAELTEVQMERLQTLQGATDLMTSSLEAMWFQIAHQVAPMMKSWERTVRLVADIITLLPDHLQMLIGFLILTGAALGGVITSLIQVTAMLVMTGAAMATYSVEIQKTTVNQEMFNIAYQSFIKMLKLSLPLLKQLVVKVGMLAGQMVMMTGGIALLVRAWDEGEPILYAAGIIVMGLAYALGFLRVRMGQNIVAAGKNAKAITALTSAKEIENKATHKQLLHYGKLFKAREATLQQRKRETISELEFAKANNVVTTQRIWERKVKESHLAIDELRNKQSAMENKLLSAKTKKLMSYTSTQAGANKLEAAGITLKEIHNSRVLSLAFSYSALAIAVAAALGGLFLLYKAYEDGDYILGVLATSVLAFAAAVHFARDSVNAFITAQLKKIKSSLADFAANSKLIASLKGYILAAFGAKSATEGLTFAKWQYAAAASAALGIIGVLWLVWNESRDAAMALAAAIVVVTAVMWKLNIAMWANPILLVVGLIGLLIMALYRWWDTISNYVMPVLEYLWNVLKGLLAPLLLTIRLIWMGVQRLRQFVDSAGGASAILQRLWNVLKGLFLPLRLVIWGIRELIDRAGGASAILQRVVQVLRIIFAPLILVGKLIQWVVDRLGGWGAILGYIYEGLKFLLWPLIELIKLLEELGSKFPILGKLGSFAEILEYLSDPMQVIKDLINAVADAFDNLLSRIPNVLSGLSRIGSAIRSSVSGAFESAGESLRSFGGRVMSALGRSWIVDAFSSGIGQITGMFAGLQEMMGMLGFGNIGQISTVQAGPVQPTSSMPGEINITLNTTIDESMSADEHAELVEDAVEKALYQWNREFKKT